jgi:hypothetical protein
MIDSEIENALVDFGMRGGQAPSDDFVRILVSATEILGERVCAGCGYSFKAHVLQALQGGAVGHRLGEQSLN